MDNTVSELQVNFKKIFVIDTNIILDDATQLFTLGQDGENLIVLPETVIDEIDIKKSGFDEINFQARQFGRILSEAKVETSHKNGEAVTTRLTLEGNTIDIVAMFKYEVDSLDKSIINDRKIIQCAEYINRKYGKNVTLLSNDIMCRTRAISVGVQTEGLGANLDAQTPEFIKVLNVDSSLFNSIRGKRITDIDPDYKPENYCYQFQSSDGNQQLGYIVKGMIRFVDEDELRKSDVKPLNRGQLFAAAGMADKDIDITVVEALAGSGKTLLAVAAGMKLVKKGEYDKLVYIRNSVESVDSAEAVGFLSGNEEKFKIYNYPLYDTLEFLAQKGKNKKLTNQDAIQQQIDSLMESYNIETMWPGSIRGRTIKNAYVILDETQNFSKKSLQTVMTRLDDDCKLVIVGSNRQIDHPYLTKHTNGLSVLLKAATEHHDDIQMFGTELDRGVRGKITEFSERVFSGN